MKIALIAAGVVITAGITFVGAAVGVIAYICYNSDVE